MSDETGTDLAGSLTACRLGGGGAGRKDIFGGAVQELAVPC
jgi:hypothetical protein